eukprot:38060-Pelagomonas_calceolata.AAC.1
MPSLPTTCPRKCSSGLLRLHLLSFAFSSYLHSSSKTIRSYRCCSYSSGVRDIPKISSRYTKTKFPMYSRKSVFIARWNVAGAFVNPKHKTLKWNWPKGL